MPPGPLLRRLELSCSEVAWARVIWRRWLQKPSLDAVLRVSPPPSCGGHPNCGSRERRFTFA